MHEGIAAETGKEGMVNTDTGKLAVLILAAGKGTRMKSDLAKVLHPVCGLPMLYYPVALAKEIGAERIAVVIGHQAEDIRKQFCGEGVLFVEQTEQLGTAHAVLQAKDIFKDFRGTVVILCGDVPLLSAETVRHILACHHGEAAMLTVLTAVLEEPGNYGRVVKGKDHTVERIVEARDATPEELRIREINTGIYCAESDFLFSAVGRIGCANAQCEYYLTDIFDIARLEHKKTIACTIDDPMEAMGINTVEELEKADGLLRKRKV